MRSLLKRYAKHYVISILIFTFLMVANAHATTIQTNSDRHWYIGGFLGSHFSSNGKTHIPSIASKPPLTSEPVYNAGSVLGLNMGYQYHPSFRVEGEFTYQDLPVHKINNAIGVGTVTYVSNSRTKLLSTFINGYYDFSCYHGWIPYIGLGVGYVDVKNRIKPTLPIPVGPGLFFTIKEINYNTFGYQGMLGVVYPLTDTIYLKLDYKYFSTLEQEARGKTNLGPDGYKTRQKVTYNMISLGIKYFF